MMNIQMKIIKYLGIILLYCASSLWACDIPVFRFALEEWVSDEYRVTVFYKEALPADGIDKLETLANQSRQIFGQVPDMMEIKPVEPRANMTVRYADLETEQDAMTQKLWQTQNTEVLPWVIVRFPRTARMKHALWSGPLAKFDSDTLLHSLARQQVFEKLSQGASAVWVLLETGNKIQDEKTFETLKAELAKAEKTLKLPEIDNADLDEMGLPLKVSFPVMKVSRAAVQEIPFITMLIKSEPQLMNHLQKPMAFPIYGRGRSLYGLAGDAINSDNIFRACRILLESCKCEIKDDNPGTDMLFRADWDGIFETVPKLSNRPPTLVGLSDLIDTNKPAENAAPENQPASMAVSADVPPDINVGPVEMQEKSLAKPGGYGILMKTGAMVAGALVLIALGTVLIRKNII